MSRRECYVCGKTPRAPRNAGGYVICPSCRDGQIAAGKRLIREACERLGIREVSLLRRYARTPRIVYARQQIVIELRDTHRAAWQLIASLIGLRTHMAVMALYRKGKQRTG